MFTYCRVCKKTYILILSSVTPDYFILLFFSASFILCVPQWEREAGEAAFRAAAGGGLPASGAGCTEEFVTGPPETTRPPEAAEGGPGNAAVTPACRSPQRVHSSSNNDLCITNILSSPIDFTRHVVKTQIASTCQKIEILNDFYRNAPTER